MFIYTQYIEPDWVDKVSEVWTQMMQDDGVSKENIDQQLASFKKAYEPLPLFTVELLKYGVSQFILGIFVSLFFIIRARRKPTS